VAVGIDADTENVTRTGIPGSGNAGRLCNGGYKDTFTGVWLYRPSGTATYALTAGGKIIYLNSGPREVHIGFNSAGAALADLSLNIVFNSGGGAGSDQTFASHGGDDFLDEWVYYFILDNSTSGQIAGYIRYADLGTGVTDSITRANDNAGSQYIATQVIGNTGTTACVLGHYAYLRNRFATGITTVQALAAANSASAITGDWNFCPLANNTDTLDTSGNTRNMTFTGTLTSQTSPTLGGGGGGGITGPLMGGRLTRSGPLLRGRLVGGRLSA
jgi:hypothetical protein